MASAARLSKAELEPHIQQSLVKFWKTEKRFDSLSEQIAWLESYAGIIAFGAREARVKVANIRRRRDQATSVACSGAWMDAVENNPNCYPPPGMVLSTAEVRFGQNGRPHRRYTPPQAVDLEDRLDSLSQIGAIMHDRQFPASPSAVAIAAIGMTQGHRVKRRLKLGIVKTTREERRQAKLDRQLPAMEEIQS